MSSSQDTMTTAEKIRSAEETVARAQSALDKAQVGLHAAEEVAVKAEKVVQHPVRLVVGVAAFSGLIVLIMMLVKRRDDT